jgi:hypothetical protein
METTRRQLASLGRGLLASSFFDTTSCQQDTVYAWADVDEEELDFRILPRALPALPFHFSAMDTPSDTRAQGPLSLRPQSCVMPSCTGNDVFARSALGLDMRLGVKREM